MITFSEKQDPCSLTWVHEYDGGADEDEDEEVVLFIRKNRYGCERGKEGSE